MLLECLFIFVVVLYVCQRWAKRDIYALEKQLRSGLRSLPFLGHGYLFFGNNQTLMKAFQRLGRAAIKNEHGLCPLWIGTKFYTVMADCEAADFVLKTALAKDDIMKMATLFLGNGSIFAPVPIWKPRRRVLIPTFGTKNMKHFLWIFNKQSNVLTEQLDKVAGSGTVSIWRYYTAYTMDSIAEATLGYQMHAQTNSGHPFLQAFHTGLEQCAIRLCSPWLHSDVVYHNLPIYKKLVAMKNYMWGFLKELIDTKRKEMKKAEKNKQETNDCDSNESMTTFLELLIRSPGADDGYTDTEVLEELMVIMIAGNDTSAVGSSFVTLMFARHPDVQEKVLEELQQVFGESDRPVSSKDLPRLKYLDAVIKETLRLYPPVPVTTRKIEKEIILPSGIKLIPGTGALMNIWAIHRNPRHWGDDAEQFRPERFLDSPLKHPAAFMPFSHGPRNCVGYQFAMTSMKTVLSSVLRRYKILPAEHSPHSQPSIRPIRLKFDLMMKDVDGFQIQLEHRSKQRHSY
ncbi:unnamed protein product [Arctia plantaginis]|uniref:Cytochrome P450 n=1 Tax=Arctia plantaginis TaxID=874455 RepID=A0A8S0ZTR2_ARCPL|nr:unnamed protein product [Arctia plantaginis]